MNRTEIFKALKQKYAYLEEHGYEVVYLALQGSQNYGMEIYTEKYQSDIDCIAVILPSLDDIINNKPAISTTLILDNNEHIDLKDIRQMFNLLQKQNIKYLETLFTEYKIINKKYKHIITDLFSIRNDIATINKKPLYMNIIGLSMQKHSELFHKTNTYSGKSLHHQIRLNQFIRNLYNGLSFKEALTYFDDDIKDLCIKAKLNQFTLEEAIELDKNFLIDTNNYKLDFLSDIKCEDNINTIDKLNDIKVRVMKYYFTLQLTPKAEQCIKTNLSTYNNIYFTSDTHFGHSNILEFEHRDMKMNINGIMEHDNKLIKNWNNVVKQNDLVYILGDFSFHNAINTMEILKQLNGDKILIEGNHDCIFLKDKKFDRSLFKEIIDYKEINYKGQNICLMHYPIQKFKHIDKDINPYIHLHGHIHSVPIAVPRHSYNVGVDINNYTPIHIDKAIEKALSNTSISINGQNL